MTTAIVTHDHQTTTRSTTSRKRKPLSPARVYQAWAADVSQHGRRGAFRRTAELVGCSPEYIRQLVAKHEAEHTLKPEAFTAHELDYLPAPGELPLSRPPQPVRTASKEATPSIADAFDAYVKHDSELNSITCETGETSQLATDKQPQPAERETAVLPLASLPTITPQAAPPRLPVRPDAPVKRYAPRPKQRGLDLAQLVDLAMLMIGPVPLIAWLVFGLALLMLGMH